MNKCIEFVVSCISDHFLKPIKARQRNLVRSFPVVFLSMALKITCNSGADILHRCGQQNRDCWIEFTSRFIIAQHKNHLSKKLKPLYKMGTLCLGYLQVGQHRGILVK